MADAPKSKVLIIDPIFRGSRLMISYYAAQAVESGHTEVHLLTRSDADSDHYRELFNFPHTLFAHFQFPPDFWYGKIPGRQRRLCFQQIQELCRVHHYHSFFFTGWEEFFPGWPLSLGKAQNLFSKIPTFAMSYSPGFWLRADPGQKRSGGKRTAKRLLTLLALVRFKGLILCVLDERLFEFNAPAALSRVLSRYRLLPDPSPLVSSEPVRRTDSRVCLLLVGLQSARKGLGDVLAVLEKGALPLHLFFRLAGRLSPETAAWEERLRQTGQFQMENRFLSEKEMRLAYSLADFVVLPYASDFEGSSGVLAFATAFGKPVISTDHGLVGHRVKRHQLGLTYPAGDAEGFKKLLLDLPATGSVRYQNFSMAGLKFAGSNNENLFREKVGALLQRPPA